MSGSSILTFIQKSFRQTVETTVFNRLADKVNIVSAGQGDLTAEIKVEENHVNHFKMMHGGIVTTLADILSSAAFLTLHIKENDVFAGPKNVSVKLDMTFLKPIPLGSVLIINCSTVNQGKTLALAQVDFKDKVTGKILAKCNHLMFVKQ
ncbi:acyl-coenzyme A thioesterase 13-like [Brevipalpus obovatus]|uniref:acyl-coenzyme A thioesterase 13-like n=1 Tax=Brevipalpus obovatus TaxID=246614 RepID=UPI003D9F4B91